MRESQRVRESRTIGARKCDHEGKASGARTPNVHVLDGTAKLQRPDLPIYESYSSTRVRVPSADHIRLRKYSIARPANQLEQPIVMQEAPAAIVLSTLVSCAEKAE